ncbi:MAG: hypothetical protein ABI831_24850 [Betaproteobacteria bacterium]
METWNSYDLHIKARQLRSRQIGLAFAALADGAVSLAAAAFGTMKSAPSGGGQSGKNRSGDRTATRAVRS